MSIVKPNKQMFTENIKETLKHHLKPLLAVAVVSCTVLTVHTPVSANGLGEPRIASNSGQLDKKPSSQARKEVKLREKLSAKSLKNKAAKGDTFAAMAMAQQFAKEAQALATLPALANSAAEDAARWYSLAAQMGALQSQSLNGISLRPLRATRSRHR